MAKELESSKNHRVSISRNDDGTIILQWSIAKA